MPKVNKLFAFVAWDAANPDDEGIMAFHTGDGWMPMVGADMKRIESLRQIAGQISQASGKPYKILEFSGVKDITKALSGVDN